MLSYERCKELRDCTSEPKGGSFEMMREAAATAVLLWDQFLKIKDEERRIRIELTNEILADSDDPSKPG